MAISATNGSATMGSTEYYLVSGSTTQTPQTADAIVECMVDVNLMAAGDQFQFTVYEKINASTQRIVWQSILTGAQAQPQLVFPSLILMDGWDIGIKKLAGTDRAMNFSVRKVS